jgi:hypothetical protein
VAACVDSCSILAAFSGFSQACRVDALTSRSYLALIATMTSSSFLLGLLRFSSMAYSFCCAVHALSYRHGALIEQSKQYPYEKKSKRLQRFVRLREKNRYTARNEFVVSSTVSMAQARGVSSIQTSKKIRDPREKKKKQKCTRNGRKYGSVETMKKALKETKKLIIKNNKNCINRSKSKLNF